MEHEETTEELDSVERAEERRQRILDAFPDVRDGLTRKERIVLHVMHETQKELHGRSVPTLMLYGRVLERVDVSKEELVHILRRLGAGPIVR